MCAIKNERILTMKKQNFILIAALLVFGCNHVSAKLNNFGISDIIPSHADDNNAFDLRISEELTNGKPLEFHGRHTTSFTLSDILKFIPQIDACFQNFLNHADNQDPNDFELIRLAIIDVEKAKKMLSPQDVTSDDEHDLRYLFDPIKTEVNAYKHTDNVEGSSYIR